ncbi:cadmium-translocating P-type ATPase [Lactococcus lactis subsp. lactis]|uniref:heavy metal translocating P-type ATPase n=1 Tax=Lactococcus lactis TaxID=1358 RepID=UPI00071E6053|nr:heavy metal translocating P-type ATPase [Lactococcus lactis]KST77744.1 Lead cadmium zinc and mercury transporting ATPase Copper-translocating P-type ATPase [Lactococcus lactis subsp. lactis]MBS3729507.1 cadmium-translocating P-type ATPase [Lactococcus lactis subsp. lactis]MBU7531565.1 cadmium-translocating P-type ATPase [Lactococcus lactis]MBU7542868.1 cadmium-translocating P-type ATPase [Lactococcus lactis]MDO6176881.1 heavy metal translocating P-type ATPase [Lactococcus lactis]
MSNKTHSSNHDEMMSEHHHNHEIMDMEHENHEMHNMHNMDNMHDMHDMDNMDNMHDMDNMDMMNHGGHMMHMGDMSKKLKVAIILMIPLLLISPIAGFTILKFPGSEILQLILGTIIFFYSGTPFFSGAKGELKSRKPAMMMLITMGITVAYAYSVYATIMSLNGHMGMNFWFELATLIVIMLIGHLIEMKAIMGAGDALKDLASLVPKKAHLKSGKDVELSELKVGDLLLVKENEKIPADGLILSQALVDESMITGESRAVNKKTNDLVYGGSLNQNQPFEMKVTTLGKDSFLNQVAELVKKAQAQKSNLENMADRVAGYLFYAALIVGIFSLVFWTISSNFSFALLLAVSVFVIACPHALGLAVPLVVSRLTSISAKNGLLIQNRTSLEKINTIKYALMDKTGTLTDGKFIVRNVIDFTDETDILQIMAALEGSSTHPIAQSIVSAAKPLENLKVEAVENIPGVGIKGQVNQNFYQIVNYKYLRENQLSYDEKKIAQYLDLGLTVSFLINEQQDVLGFIALGDSPKADAKAFINGLLAQGITPVMLTGDNKETAQKIASALNIPEFRAELKPEDKAEIVKEYQKKAGVLFIGDGVNDSPALATATIGFAIGAGTSVAISTADVVLVNSNPSDVLDMINISKRMLRKMKQNLWFGAGYNIIAIPVAAGILYPFTGIYIDPLIAAVLMSISTVIVSINAMGLRYDKK